MVQSQERADECRLHDVRFTSVTKTGCKRPPQSRWHAAGLTFACQSWAPPKRKEENNKLLLEENNKLLQKTISCCLRSAVVRGHAAPNAPRIVPLVVSHDLRVIGPVVIIIIWALVTRRVRPGRDVIRVVRRPSQSVVHLVIETSRVVVRKVKGTRASALGNGSSLLTRSRGDRWGHLAEICAQHLVRLNSERDGRLLKEARHGPDGGHLRQQKAQFS